MAEKRHHDTVNPDVESDVPGEVIDFLQRLSSALKERDIETLTTMYDVEMQQLNDRFFSVPHTGYNHRGPKPQAKHWPQTKYVKQHFAHPQIEQLYHLHQFKGQYADRNVSAQVRKMAWQAAEKAFETFSSSKDVVVDLPNGWIWDNVDEFLYQLQTHRIRRLRPEQAATIPANCWSVVEATARLEAVVEATGVRKVLDKVAKNTAAAAEVFQQDEGHLRTVLGYSAAVGLVKVRVLLGDYVGALEAAEVLGVRSFGAAVSRVVPALHVNLYYHVGFAYLMLNRHADAVAALQLALTVKSGNKKFVDSMQSQVASLLLIAGTLGDLPPQDYASSVPDRNRAAQDDDAVLLAQGELERYRDMFLRACPKFITAADVTSGTASSFSETGQEAKELQLRMFLRSVNQRLNVLKLRGYFGAYSALTTAKVSSLLQASSGAPVEAHLVATKRGARQRVRQQGEPLTAGAWKRVGVIDFTAADGSIGVQRHFAQPTIAAALFDRVGAVAPLA